METSKTNQQKTADFFRQFNLLLNRFFVLFIILLALIVFTLGYFLKLKEQYHQIAQARDVELYRASQTLAQLKQEKISLAQNQEQEIVFSDADQAALNLALPPTFDFPSIVTQLYVLSHEANFEISSLNIKEAKIDAKAPTPDQLKKISIELEVAGGDYDDFKSFLAGLESSLMIFDVQSTDYASGKGNYKLNLVSYYYN